MKDRYNNYCLIVACLGCLFLTSCDYADGKGNTSENAVYMETPESKGVIPFTLEPSGGMVSITPRLANITDKEVRIRVDYDPSVLDRYNETNRTNYTALPDSAFVLEADGKQSKEGSMWVKVDKGDFTANLDLSVGVLNVTDFPNSVKYAIPLSITESSAYQLIPSQRSVILMLNRPLVTSVARFVDHGIQIKPTRVLSNQEWTIQMSALYSSLTRGNLTTAYISNAGGSEFYTRISGTAGIQVKNGRDGDDTWTQVPLLPNRWLHISFVYKDRTVTVYVNGKVHKVFSTAAIYFTSDSRLTVGNDVYRNDYVREVRLWSKALTEADINDMLYTPLSPQLPGLEVYLPLTKEVGVKDLIAPEGDENITQWGKITWLENVKFPADELIIIPTE